MKIENYLNKEAIISIAFASHIIDGGSIPVSIVGKVVSVDNEFIDIEFDPDKKENKLYVKNTAGKMIVKKEYLISIILLQNDLTKN